MSPAETPGQPQGLRPEDLRSASLNATLFLAKRLIGSKSQMYAFLVENSVSLFTGDTGRKDETPPCPSKT